MIAEAVKTARLRVELRRLDRARGYRAYGSTELIQHDTSPELLLAGPAGTGKSRGCLEKLNESAWAYPKSRHLVVRKTRRSLTESALFTFEQYVLGVNNPMVLNGPRRQYRDYYQYPNGSVIVIGGMDTPDKVMSTEYDTILVQEATELVESDWESLTSRLRNGRMPYQQLLADCNPSHPKHWLKLRCDRGVTKMYESFHEDNPVLYDQERGEWTERGLHYVFTVLEALTGVRYQRLRLGKWRAAEGVVYDQYDSNVHLINRFRIPSDWRRFRVVDFGYTNPFVCQWWAVDPDERLYLYREIYYTHRTVKEHARDILELSEGEYIEATICDHDAENRAQLDEYGIPNEPAIKAVGMGIEKVQDRLKVEGDKKPRLFILRDSLIELDKTLEDQKLPTCTENEIEAYVWENSNKERPVKKDDHGCDAIRYGVMYLDGSTSWGEGSPE